MPDIDLSHLQLGYQILVLVYAYPPVSIVGLALKKYRFELWEGISGNYVNYAILDCTSFVF